MKLNELVSYPDLYSLSTTTHKLHTARALELTMYFAASSPQHNGNLQVNYILGSRGGSSASNEPLWLRAWMEVQNSTKWQFIVLGEGVLGL